MRRSGIEGLAAWLYLQVAFVFLNELQVAFVFLLVLNTSHQTHKVV